MAILRLILFCASIFGALNPGFQSLNPGFQSLATPKLVVNVVGEL